VEMASADEAQAVISALNGRDVGGRTLTVSMAREREPRSGGPGRGGFGRDRTGGGGRRERY